MGESKVPSTYIEYSTVTGYFLQDDDGVDPNTFDYVATNFGLIDREYDTDKDYFHPHPVTGWQRFNHMLNQWNGNEKANGVQYKLLYLGRHGEGDHNVAEAFYGTKAWDCYWSLQDGNETTTWADASLTPIGIAQAQTNAVFLQGLLDEQHLPHPQKYYTSPLARCLETCYHTWGTLTLPRERPFHPIIKELFRECIGAHTCDRRSSKTFIQHLHPDWSIEPGFTEEDPLWKPDLRETDSGMDTRTKTVLDDVFRNDTSTYISITSHSGEIASMLRVLGHRPFGLKTGGMIPVLVKAEVRDGWGPPPSREPAWMKVEACATPPPGAQGNF